MRQEPNLGVYHTPRQAWRLCQAFMLRLNLWIRAELLSCPRRHLVLERAMNPDFSMSHVYHQLFYHWRTWGRDLYRYPSVLVDCIVQFFRASLLVQRQTYLRQERHEREGIPYLCNVCFGWGRIVYLPYQVSEIMRPIQIYAFEVHQSESPAIEAATDNATDNTESVVVELGDVETTDHQNIETTGNTDDGDDDMTEETNSDDSEDDQGGSAGNYDDNGNDDNGNDDNGNDDNGNDDNGNDDNDSDDNGNDDNDNDNGGGSSSGNSGHENDDSGDMPEDHPEDSHSGNADSGKDNNERSGDESSEDEKSDDQSEDDKGNTSEHSTNDNHDQISKLAPPLHPGKGNVSRVGLWTEGLFTISTEVEDHTGNILLESPTPIASMRPQFIDSESIDISSFAIKTEASMETSMYATEEYTSIHGSDRAALDSSSLRSNTEASPESDVTVVNIVDDDTVTVIGPAFTGVAAAVSAVTDAVTDSVVSEFIDSYADPGSPKSFGDASLVSDTTTLTSALVTPTITAKSGFPSPPKPPIPSKTMHPRSGAAPPLSQDAPPPLPALALTLQDSLMHEAGLHAQRRRQTKRSVVARGMSTHVEPEYTPEPFPVSTHGAHVYSPQDASEATIPFPELEIMTDKEYRARYSDSTFGSTTTRKLLHKSRASLGHLFRMGKDKEDHTNPGLKINAKPKSLGHKKSTSLAGYFKSREPRVDARIVHDSGYDAMVAQMDARFRLRPCE